MTKTPAELNAEWERIAADLGEGIVTAVERAEADAAANAVKTEREAIAAWLEWFGRETAFPGSFHALAVAVKQGDYPRDLPGREEREERLREEGRREEREATVAFLSDLATVAEDAPLVATNFRSAADRIEEGVHRHKGDK
jgi:hypothetical protein